GLLRGAQLAGWHAHAAPVPRADSAVGLRWAPTAAFALMCASLAGYAFTVVLECSDIERTVTLMSALALVGLLVAAAPCRPGEAGWVERVGAYLGVLLLVYLDEAERATPLASDFLWALLGVLVISALLVFCVAPKRRFQLTSLDLLVVFIALVIPNLPGGTLT